MWVSFLDFGSYICRWRLDRPIGVSFADGCVDPSLQKAGLSNGRTAEVSHRRPWWSSIGLWTLFLLFQIGSVPQYGEGAAISGGVDGVAGSRTSSGMRL